MFIYIVRPEVCEGMECFRSQIPSLKSQIKFPYRSNERKLTAALRFREQARVVVTMGRLDLRKLHILFDVFEAAHADQRGGDARR